eukprot:scaffold34120_cov74-Phaeocystis_antarctica.AAC.1
MAALWRPASPPKAAMRVWRARVPPTDFGSSPARRVVRVGDRHGDLVPRGGHALLPHFEEGHVEQRTRDRREHLRGR